MCACVCVYRMSALGAARVFGGSMAPTACLALLSSSRSEFFVVGFRARGVVCRV